MTEHLVLQALKSWESGTRDTGASELLQSVGPSFVELLIPVLCLILFFVLFFRCVQSSNLMAIYVLSMCPNIFHSLISMLCVPSSSFRWLIWGQRFSLAMLMFGSHLNKTTKCQTRTATFLYPGEQSLHRSLRISTLDSGWHCKHEKNKNKTLLKE